METVILSHGPWEAHIAPSYCGNTIRLRHEGKAMLREPQDEAAMRAAPVLYGTPAIMPANRTRHGRFCFEGTEYALPVNEAQHGNHLHGSLHVSEMKVEAQQSDRVSLSMENHGGIYPFPFRLELDCQIEQEGYRQRFTFINTAERAMPLVFAVHTTFVADVFRAGLGRRWETDDSYIPTGRLLPLTDTEREYTTGFDPARGKISGFYTMEGPEAQIGPLAYHVRGPFDQWILFNRNAQSGFLCVEPQCGAVNGLNMRDGHYRLEAGETVVFETSMIYAPMPGSW